MSERPQPPEDDPSGGRDPDAERRAARAIAVLLVLTMLAGVGLLVLYMLGGLPWLEGTLLALALGAVGFGLILWGRSLFPPEIVTEERGPHGSDPSDVARAERAFESGEGVPRRAFLVRLLVGAGAALGLAAIFPIRSLGPGPRGALFHTGWRRGSRLVDDAGKLVRADQLEVGGVVTVFPEGRTTAEDAQAILVKVPVAELRLPPGRDGWAPQGNVCYSKICTHAGCPVGLYSVEIHQLQCPCHQSAFDVLAGAEPVFGPAPRPLPQLPIEVDEEGYLVAGGDFSGPVGPGFWNIGRGS